MIRSIGAVLGGYLTMVLIVIPTTLIASRLLARSKPTPAYLGVNLLCAMLAAIAAGFVCAWIADGHVWEHIIALAAFVLAMSVVSAKSGQSGAPAVSKWYPYTLAAIGIAGVILGGAIRSME